MQISVYKLGNPDGSKITITQNPTTIGKGNNSSEVFFRIPPKKKIVGSVYKLDQNSRMLTVVRAERSEKGNSLCFSIL